MKTVLGIFADSKMAGRCISELKEKGYTKDISVVAKDAKYDEHSHQIKQDVSDGMATGATTGGVLGAIGGILAGAASFFVPGIGFVVLGPLATTLAGAAAGALTGGIVGTLVDWGIPEKQAKEYQDRITQGEVLVAIETDEKRLDEVRRIMNNYGVEFIDTPQNRHHSMTM